MLKEKWSKGKEPGCVVSDTPNRHNRDDDHVDYYGGYLIAESIPKQEYVTVIARSLSMRALLEKALPIIEREADARCDAMQQNGLTTDDSAYWVEMIELKREISAEIDKAYGREAKDE